ncbi:hypothetical protein PTTG_05876 [Puccinia triticina 1-1 BBBD Race 1]|uniref:Uncharacterized protein n=2 Tax=Puccinia triticina TaxID=208348 RepID=A0A0C4EYH6_PUCT1|nr:uncharacterized protein PtA15_11A488 [Puccinia triticina]OAV95817.1 hypothetical protein PTTG_05876 [Puccinia triticina 1-1 BBBD Race 1]WAQ89797.1 hypothetical protein PtA15_11A488 [Puccinia triticina]
MVLQDKYKRANSSRYRATHGGIQSNRQKAKAATASIGPSSPSQQQQPPAEDFPQLIQPSSAPPADDLQPSQTAETLLPLAHPPAAPPPPNPTFSRRQLASNAHRYLEPEPDPNEEPEPEIDLTYFVEKHRTKIEAEEVRSKEPDEEQDVDQSFDHLFKHSTRPGHVQHSLSSTGIHGSAGKPAKVFIEDSSSLGLEELDNERKKADATRELIARFSAHQLGPKTTGPPKPNRRPLARQKPKLNTPNPPSSNPKELVHPLDDEDFLDEVLNDSSGTYGKFKRT